MITHKRPSQQKADQSIKPPQQHSENDQNALAGSLRRAGNASEQLTPGDLLRLQRTIGNQAVQRLLDQRKQQPSDDNPQPKLADAEGAIRRAVGFEFETSWYVTRGDGKALPKYEPIYTGAGFRMEADTPSSGTSDIEFVVKPPFEESAGGVNNLGVVMPAMRNYFQNLAARNGQTLQGPALLGFVDADKSDVIITRGGDMSATPQTTVGVRLDHLIELLTELQRPGGDAKDELLGLQGRQAANVNFLSQAQDPVVGNAALGVAAATDPNRGGYVPTPAMQGLLAMILHYLKRGAVMGGVAPYAQAFKYAKSMLTIMGRTSFSGMFKALPQAEKDYYIANPNHWVQFVLQTAGGMNPTGNVIERGLKGDPPKFNKKGVQTKAGKVTEIPINRREWLLGMLVGADLLTQDAFKRLNPKSKVQFSESFGALGEKTDDVGPAQLDKGVIIELREIKSDLDYQDWEQFASDVMTYIMALNSFNPGGGGAAPQYQKTATPARGIRP